MRTAFSRAICLTGLLACAETPRPITCEWAVSTAGALYVCVTAPQLAEGYISCRDRSGSSILVREATVLTIHQTCR